MRDEAQEGQGHMAGGPWELLCGPWCGVWILPQSQTGVRLLNVTGLAIQEGPSGSTGGIMGERGG